MKRSWKSFIDAATGLRELVSNHRNSKIMLLATLVVIAGGLILELGRVDWCLVILVTAAVWIAESFNTALELLCDRVTTEHDELIRKAKDIAAGATLIAVIASLFVGISVGYRYAFM
ncbi:MAG: hypothetical protein RL326_1012 [Pseudomonadota bacterium]|jgi:diacylglycerol kinase (ATP)